MTMFGERLQGIHDRLDGSLAVSLVGRDGIPVESHLGTEVDVETLAAELLTQVRAISDDHRELAIGPVRQFAVTTDRFTVMLGALTDEYFLLLVLGEAASLGRARYELRRASLDFDDDLV
jgi:predicted regulator of Ras-like GTPase activity (Roadblock/LC7/MglB family)